MNRVHTLIIITKTRKVNRDFNAKSAEMPIYFENVWSFKVYYYLYMQYINEDM